MHTNRFIFGLNLSLQEVNFCILGTATLCSGCNAVQKHCKLRANKLHAKLRIVLLHVAA